MNKKVTALFCASLMTLALTQTAQAGPDPANRIYKGFEQIGTGRIVEASPLSPGAQTNGLKNTMLSQLLNGPDGEVFTVEAEKGTTGNNLLADVQMVKDTKRVFEFDLKHQDQRKGAHLVVVIPGFGASFKEGAATYLSELLNRNGMVTLSSHSPANPEFIKNSSALAIPGNQAWDAQDIYDSILLAIPKLKKDFGYEFSKVSVIGASLGSMNAFHILGIDLKNRKRSKDSIPNLHRVVSLNPPVSNSYGSSTIDTFVAISKFQSDTFDFLDALATFKDALTSLAISMIGKKEFDTVKEKSLKAKERMDNSGFNDARLKFLVGIGFAPTVVETIAEGKARYQREAAESMINQYQVMPTKYFTGFLLTHSMKDAYGPIRCGSFNQCIWDYEVDHGGIKTGVKYLRLRDKFSFVEEDYPHLYFSELESIGYLVPKWQNDEEYDLSQYHLISWYDDFLLRASDTEWIRTNLPGGNKGTGKVFETVDIGGGQTYDGGGHLGGYWQKEFQEYLLNVLKN